MRRTRADLPALLWRLASLARITLPVPVTEKRRLAPVIVFILGTGQSLPHRRRWGRGRCRPPGFLGDLLLRRHDHREKAAFHRRRLFQCTKFLHALVDAVEEGTADLRVGDLAAAEHDADLDFVALLEELLHVPRLEVDVVVVDLRLHADLAED